MEIGMGMSLECRQEMRMDLAQRIEFMTLLAFPPRTLKDVLNSLKTDYERAEAILSAKAEKHGDKGTKGLFNYLHESKCLENHGFILNTGAASLKGFISRENTEVEPDVTFRQRANKFDRPEIDFSSSILPVKMEMSQIQELIPPQFKKTRRLYADLLRFANWINNLAITGYGLLADVQREFINTLEPTMRNAYSAEQFAGDLSVHQITVYRMVNGRYVSVEDADRSHKTIMPVKRLLSTRGDKRTCLNLHGLNAYFTREAESKECLSDAEIAETIGCSRRAITKYRLSANIPNSRGRCETYRVNPVLRYAVKID